MGYLSQQEGWTEIVIDKFDGGLNTKDTPPRLEINESPDCLNVVFDAQGSVQTRNGASLINTSTIEPGSFACDGLATFNGTMIGAFGGTLYRQSGTTWVTIASSQNQLKTGANVAFETYQQVLFCSEGTGGPWRYTGDGFYTMGIPTPSAPTSTSNTPGAGFPETGSYNYKIAYRNTAAVVGAAGSQSVTLTISTSAQIYLTNIPLGTTSQGVAQRYIYRASVPSGPYRYVGSLTDNVTTIFTDSVQSTTWAVGAQPNLDATAPTPFTTLKLHKDRMFFDDSSDRTILRYTDYRNPYVSEALNFINIDKGDLSNITALGVQDDFLTVFKQNAIWIVNLVAPGDDTTWQFEKISGNLGIVGPKALCEIQNGILFLGRRNNFITGFHIISGVNLLETGDQRLRVDTISRNIEPDILLFPSSQWANSSMVQYKNKIFCAVAKSGDSVPSHIYWFDINRVNDDGKIGSWSLWDGRASQVQNFIVHSDGFLYAGSSLADGYLLRLEKSAQYNDAGASINSYYWTKPYGGIVDVNSPDTILESWIKDFRFANLWYYKLGAWFMRVNYRLDGDSGSGNYYQLDLTPGGSVWGTMNWGTSTWGGSQTDFEHQDSLGVTQGRRIQLGFNNNNTVNTAFKVHSLKLLMDLRRQR